MSCTVCGSETWVELGQLGNLHHYQCRNCGNGASRWVDHDVLANGKTTKADNEHPYPHVACCAGCRRLSVCHGCGFPVSMSGGYTTLHGAPINTLARCTSGACPRCCAELHKHPQG
jgi:hypothetical protein